MRQAHIGERQEAGQEGDASHTQGQDIEGTGDPEGLFLPSVWQTDDLGTPITSVAIAGALGSTVAITFEDGGLQFVNLDGERVTDKSDIGVAAVADGRFMLLQGTPVTLFPGITTSGDLSLYLHGGELTEPAEAQD